MGGFVPCLSRLSAGSRAGAVEVPVLVEGLPWPAPSMLCRSLCSSLVTRVDRFLHRGPQQQWGVKID
ncbi:hypothetical protein Nmel_010516 [Mimus melanotis]